LKKLTKLENAKNLFSIGPNLHSRGTLFTWTAAGAFNGGMKILK